MNSSLRESLATSGGAPIPCSSIKGAVSAAHSIAPAIKARSADVDRDRMVSSDIVGQIREAGLFGLMAPRVFGGSELGVEALVRVVIEIATACGSTGWICGVLSGHSWMLSLFPAEVQREIAKNPCALIATVFRF